MPSWISAGRSRSILAAALVLASIASAAPAHAQLQPVLGHDAGDTLGAQATFLARVYGGRAFALLAQVPAPLLLQAGDLAVSERTRLEELRPGDLIAVRTDGNPAPYFTDPVSLRRFDRLAGCDPDCTLVVTTTLAREGAETVRRAAVVGRVVFALDRRSGTLRQFRDPDAPRTVTVADAYNERRPRWGADAVGRRLRQLHAPAARPTPTSEGD